MCLVKPIRHVKIPNSEVVVKKFGDTFKVTCADGYGISGSDIICKADEIFVECHGEFILIF